MLAARLASRSARVGVVGLGYVGLPLVRAMHTAGFSVVGYDIDEAKIADLKAGRAYLKHLGEGLVRELAASSRFVATSRASDLEACDAIVLCVPTPLDAHEQPDLGYVVSSAEMVGRVLSTRRATGVVEPVLVSLESTSYPGTTREVCGSILSRHGAAIGRDVFLVFSPEREDPGRVGVDTRTITRLVGGVDAASTRVGAALYGAAVERVVTVESAEVAEAAKLLENIYRAVNIALVNELKPVLADMGIDIWSVIRAAATKPFGFQAFYPGPGLGGHCIPIDPFYLTYKAREFGHRTRFIELAGEINSTMPRRVVERVALALNEDGRAVRGAKVLLIGIAYKKDIDDVRETPAAEIATRLGELGAVVSYHDPHVARFPSMRNYRLDLESVALDEATLAGSACVVIVTDHMAVDYAMIGRHAPLIVDTRNAMARVVEAGQAVKARIVKA
jgi:UDP-N-acetyl-D-glucosamine dehydrogenase